MKAAAMGIVTVGLVASLGGMWFLGQIRWGLVRFG